MSEKRYAVSTMSEKRWTVYICPDPKCGLQHGGVTRCYGRAHEDASLRSQLPVAVPVEVVPASTLQELREGLQREIEGLADKANAARDYAEKLGDANAQGKSVTRACAFEEAEWRLRRLRDGEPLPLPHSPDGREEGTDG